jgi:lipopolysaccharide assembly outer membrane protein LptD (OstA)
MDLKMPGLLRRCAPRNDEENNVIATPAKGGGKQSRNKVFSRTMSISLLLSYVWFSPLYGLTNRTANENQPVLYYADSQTYDRELGILILKGHVEFEQQSSILEADYVTYNENTNIVTASGNVRIRQPGGDINFAEYVELTGDMKEGIVLSLRTLLEDNSKIAALEGRKFEDREELDQAVYTPCEFCGDKPPTWQINARRAVKDNANKNIHFGLAGDVSSLCKTASRTEKRVFDSSP